MKLDLGYSPIKHHVLYNVFGNNVTLFLSPQSKSQHDNKHPNN